MKLLNDPMIRKLIEVFDLEVPEQYILRISEYELINNEIVIKKIQVLDKDGKFIRFVDIKKVLPYLSKYYTVFGNRTTNTIKAN
jgi:uncharacterized ubiquitin-like protein YukD